MLCFDHKKDRHIKIQNYDSNFMTAAFVYFFNDKILLRVNVLKRIEMEFF